MKKIVALISLIAISITSVFSLVSCSDDEKIPDRMQLIAGGESLGYYFYGPEEWTISNIGSIKSAYASRVDSSSVSFTEVYPVDFLPDGVSEADEYFFNSYFGNSLSEFPNEPKLSNPDGENIIFGKESTEDVNVVEDVSESYFDNLVVLLSAGQTHKRLESFSFSTGNDAHYTGGCFSGRH